MKLFEYMATGRAILTSDLPVIREVLNESNALLRPTGRSASLAKFSRGTYSKIPRLCDKLERMPARDAQNYSWKERERKALDAFPD